MNTGILLHYRGDNCDQLRHFGGTLNDTTKTTVAVIGGGMVSKTHLLAIADLSDTLQLGGVYSRSSQSRNALAAEAEAICDTPCKVYDSIDAICVDEAIDFAILLTPPNARLDITQKLAAAGKAILMEKPVERTSDAAEQIVQTCEEADVTLGIVFQHRVRAASEKLAALIANGSLGKLVLAEASVPWWRDQSYYDEPGRGTYARDGGGVLISQAIHTMDLLLSLTGPVSEVMAMAHTTPLHQMESEDYVTASLRFANGAAGSLMASTAHFPGDAESIKLHFEKAVAHLQSGVLRLDWRDGRAEEFGETATTGGGADPMAFTHAWHQDIIDDFAKALQEDRDPLVTGRTALDVHRLIEAIVTSSTEKRAVALTS